MESSAPRRKACDLCYRKKIKCDGQRPRCSPCLVYESECTYRAASRKTPSRKQAAAQRQLREEALSSRIKALEDRLSTVLQDVQRFESTSSSKNQESSSSTPQAITEDAGPSHQAAEVNTRDLPPIQEILPLVKYYLATFNFVLPLFHHGTILETFKNWYQSPHSRDNVTWALLSVVIALAHHTSSPDDATSTLKTATYLNNAQSVLSEVIMRETELVNVQIVLGMVMLFWTSDDLQPALLLIATALRLAQKLGFHSRKRSEHLSPALALQRDRIFWIAYILDRDISLQAEMAPIQLERDVDLDLPPLEAGTDLTGFIFTDDGATRMNFFRARVELARIQGKVCDCVYSTAAQNSSPAERAQNIARIYHVLDMWNAQIPPAFHITALPQANTSGVSRYLCILYSTSLSCRSIASLASARDSYHYSRWFRHIHEYGCKVVAGYDDSHAPVPQGWQTLVHESREYLHFFATVTPIDGFLLRLALCAYNSSLIALTANSIFNAHRKIVESDRELIRTAMLFLETLVKQIGRKHLQTVQGVLEQMRLHAELISQRYLHS